MGNHSNLSLESKLSSNSEQGAQGEATFGIDHGPQHFCTIHAAPMLMFNDSCYCVLFGPGDVVQKYFNSPALVRMWNTFLMVGWSHLQHNCSNHMNNSGVYFRVMNQFHVHGCNA
ncbi:unnamed protein product [Sphagnum jensenii]|uniref:Uncharacterized protein n=1 Tax=Sphagnum jensenii TaxID=128206 RepID=A0ABP0WCK7_9BRYO